MIKIHKSFPLTLLCRFHSLANDRRRFAKAIIEEFLVIYTRDFDVNINSIQQGTEMRF